MSAPFYSSKSQTLIKSLNLERVKEIINNDRRANSYLDRLEIVLAGADDRTVTNSELAELINDASDRAIFNRVEINRANRIVVKHLLSGEELELKKLNSAQIGNLLNVSNIDNNRTAQATQDISLQELFWWLWRCLPEAIASGTNAESLLIPASNNLPDASIWSDASLSAALAGALVGYSDNETESRPELAIFSFSPIQELIKASRKMRDFWAGSWLLHYLSAKVCWNIAIKYGPDSLVYPSLYQQPLIDRWLLDKYPNFSDWIHSPSNRSLLTAGFPNVIVVVLPKSQVKAAMQTARQNLLQEWIYISDRVFGRLKKCGWMPNLDPEDPTWNGWLKAQWQTYWTALPLGNVDLPLVINELDDDWIKAQNLACNLPLQPSDDRRQQQPLFLNEEIEFIGTITEKASINVGSWWPYIFDQLRFALSSFKKARTWTIPTAFTMRSTISGIGSVVTPNSFDLKIEVDRDEILIEEQQQREENLQQYNRVLGLFDGKEQLNATETVKRGLHLVLEDLINPAGTLNSEQDNLEQRISASYPDLCSGVAGWLRTNLDRSDIWEYYNKACADIVRNFDWTRNKVDLTKPTALMPWGIPSIDLHDESDRNRELRRKARYNPRLLNAGWAIEDFPEKDKERKQEQLRQLKEKIEVYFSAGNNPTDWYVIAVGDGDGMGEWLKGGKLEKYERYLGDSLLNDPPQEISEALEALKRVPKRMGPSTHNALSRALLDFSNRLVPYLTEERYAGRLIYSGGDDVFAYTNLWEWDRWLWDVHQCFCGAKDPNQEFTSTGDYWQWQGDDPPENIPNRPLFTMGSKATICFGLVIAHHSVPLVIALESLWQAEAEAKEHCFVEINGENKPKDAVQVRVLFANGNILSATSKFEVFHCWQQLIEVVRELDIGDVYSLSALFELAAQNWQNHPAPFTEDAIKAWTRVFCDRREIVSDLKFPEKLLEYLQKIIAQTQEEDRDSEIKNWLKLAAFVLRNREIKLKNNSTIN